MGHETGRKFRETMDSTDDSRAEATRPHKHSDKVDCVRTSENRTIDSSDRRAPWNPFKAGGSKVKTAQNEGLEESQTVG
jgi:hypothetical protein